MDEGELEMRPILITGAARSGTSMTAGIINMSGAFGGDMFGPNKNNKRGMFENKYIRQEICKPFLKSVDADPMGQKPLPDMNIVWGKVADKTFVDSFRDSVLTSIKNQGWDGESPWFYKGAKMCLFWPLWVKAFPEAKWVIVRREGSDIVRSCMKTSFMRAYRDATGWETWLNTHIRRFQEMKSHIHEVREYWPETAIEGDLDPTYNLLAWLDLEPAVNLISDFISPVLWKEDKK